MHILHFFDSSDPQANSSKLADVRTLVDHQVDQGLPSKLHLPLPGPRSAALRLFSSLQQWSRLSPQEVALVHFHGDNSLSREKGILTQLKGIPRVLSLERGFAQRNPIPDETVDAARGKRRIKDHFGPHQVLCRMKIDQKSAERLFPDARVEYLPFGIDTDSLPRGDGLAFRFRHGIAQQNPMILVVGPTDLSPEGSAIGRAIPNMLKLHPQVILAFVASGTEREAHGTISKHYPDHHRLRVIQPPAGEEIDIKDAVSAADIVLLTQGCPDPDQVILESWCTLRPIVVPQTGEVALLTRANQDGIPYDPSDERQVLDALKVTFTQPQQTSELTRNGFTRILREFDNNRIAKRLCELYAELIEGFEERNGHWFWQ